MKTLRHWITRMNPLSRKHPKPSRTYIDWDMAAAIGHNEYRLLSGPVLNQGKA